MMVVVMMMMMVTMVIVMMLMITVDGARLGIELEPRADEQSALPVVVVGPEAPERADGLLTRLGEAADVVDYGLLEPERLGNCVIIIIESERAPEE